MSDSSPTIHERICHKAKMWAYAMARTVGVPAVEATEEAREVGDFVDRTALHIAEMRAHHGLR
jgi:hypothetical protein